MTSPHQQALHALAGLQQAHELSIIHISEQISSSTQASNPRTSDVSDAFENPTPQSLASDLAHYKELFSKLRFSYLEQVTKEKFIRSIVGDPPLIVTSAENSLLESQLLEIKSVLKTQKQEVADLIRQLEEEGRDLARRYEEISLQTTQLRDIPPQISNLENSIQSLRAQLDSSSPLSSKTPSNTANNTNGTHPHPQTQNMNLSIDKTHALISSKEKELESLDRELEQLKNALPRKTREWERLEAELQPLEVKRAAGMASAREARRRKEQRLGGVGDELEERGKWYRSVGRGVREMLGVES